MTKLKMTKASDLLKIQMKNKEFKREYDLLEEEFAIAKEIIKLRRKANLTQKQLAELSGISQPAIARLESGEYKNLTLTFLTRIGETLGVTPEIHFKKAKHL